MTVIGHIAPDLQALALLDLCDEIWGKEGEPARVIAQITPESVTTSGATHRASDGPASRSTCPRCLNLDAGMIPLADPEAVVCRVCHFIWERSNA